MYWLRAGWRRRFRRAFCPTNRPLRPPTPSRAAWRTGEVSAQPIDLTLDDAIQRGLKANLGVILSGTQTAAARGERLSQLQALLPSVDASAKETVMQVDLPAEGLRIPGFPTIIGPFGYTDLRASLSWSLVDVASLRNYLAARHNFAAAQLSAQDARELVVLTVGNAYLLVLADETRVASVEAQVATAKVSLDQAVANHQAGTAPLLDELRARVDYQSLRAAVDCGPRTLWKRTSWPWRGPSGCRWRRASRWPTRRLTRPSTRSTWTRPFARPTPTARIWRRWWSRPRRPRSSARRPPPTGCPRSTSTATTATSA